MSIINRIFRSVYRGRFRVCKPCAEVTGYGHHRKLTHRYVSKSEHDVRFQSCRLNTFVHGLSNATGVRVKLNTIRNTSMGRDFAGRGGNKKLQRNLLAVNCTTCYVRNLSNDVVPVERRSAVSYRSYRTSCDDRLGIVGGNSSSP